MSDFANITLTETVCDELLKMKVKDFIYLADERGLEELYKQLCDVFGDVVEVIVEERSE